MVTHKVREALCSEVDKMLAPYGARRVSKSERTEGVYKGYEFGWEIDTQLVFNGQPVFVRLMYDGDVNKVLPDVFVSSPRIEPLTFPHLESNGKLCVWPERFIVDLNDLGYINELLSDTATLLESAISGSIDYHFEEEFQSYWVYHCKYNFDNVCIVDLEDCRSREVSIKRIGRNGFLYGESDKQIIAWLDNQNKLHKTEGKKRARQISQISKSCIIFFERVLKPDEYPKTASELYELIKREHGNDANLIIGLIAGSLSSRNIDTPSILLSFESATGRSVVGLFFQRGLFSKHNRKAVADGFRNAIPLIHVVQRTALTPTYGGFVNRADAAWVIGRDSNTKRNLISDHKVAVIGCGSLGSSIARLLVKSGIDKIYLIDGDSVKTENISRHELGLSWVGRNKARALKDEFGLNYPHVEVEACEQYFKDTMLFRDILSDVDLVVSCTGNWYSDQAVLSIQKDECFPVIFVFVEAHACAGHVLLNIPDSGAYESIHFCSGESVGKLRNPLTVWPSETLVRIPACAGEFQPYGAIEIAHVQSIAAKKVIDIILCDGDFDMSSHTIWVGCSNDLYELGGAWNKKWEELGIKFGGGGKRIELDYDQGKWVTRSEC